MTDNLKKFGEDLKNNIPGFIALSVAEIKSGISYYSISDAKDFDPELASAFNLELVRAKVNAIQALELKEQNVDNILVTLTSQFHVIDISDDGEYFVYLAVDSDKANLGMTKSLLNKYKKDFSRRL
ncbi:hypothetical protein [Flavobacterium phragmitis]|uniref:Roadblock/LAMTOR2 domain-containing protein n=1 Tax=Flavobacterium phragmitis TaxID=739143 RepID=A0A1I1XQZ1_9FLAO|nr:hypothetical protein [Flavobacterium phragmitis]SFE09749.1 hypothetical protein SAMN05216297_12070 [Flavobacterium phragmitis]